jgi:capsular polysaccharide transport system permease protein
VQSVQTPPGPLQDTPLELIPLDRRTTAAVPVSGSARLSQWVRRQRLMLVVVALPTVLAALYFGALASNRYETESRFVIRSPGTAAAGQLSSLVQGSGIVRSSDDAYIVHAYMRSRDMVQKLMGDSDLIARLSRPEADLLWTYPGLLRRHNSERLWRHFQSFITIDFDQTTGITTLRVQAFRPGDARDIASALLEASELFINQMSGRSQTEGVQMATKEVEKNRARAHQSLDRMTEFRRRHGMIDPGRVSAAALETITRLSLDIARTNAELAELKLASPDSPQANSLRQRVSAFEEQIIKERNALAGQDTSLAPLIADYERLVLEREFEEKTFASSQSALEIMRLDAERQRLFLERISTPGLTDYPKYPSRWPSILAAFVISWMVFGILRRLIDDTRAHAGH